MQADPVYDAPETPSARQPSHKSSLTKVSVLDRLIFTHSVWLQLSLNSATSLHILQRESPGIFLVRKSATSQKKVLSVRLSDDSDPSFVHDFVLNEDSINSTFSLEGSGVTFGDLFHLISFYCVSRDVLPFTLKLPLAIATARSHKKLKTISHLGIEFWSSALNVREPPAPEEWGGESPQESGPPDFVLQSPLRTRPPGEVGRAGWNGALSFVNPLFGPEDPGGDKRSQFKRSFKVRVSTETSSPLSPPTQPPPPVPWQGGSPQPSPGPPRSASSEDDASYKRPKTPVPPPRLRKKLRSLERGPAPPLEAPLPPTAEETYRVPAPAGLPLTLRAQVGGGQRLSDASSSCASEADGLGLLYGKSPPPISKVYSQSLSSLEGEEEEEPHDPRPPPRRSRSVRWMVRAPFRKMSEVFSSFSSPEKKLVRGIEERSRDRHTYLGGLVQDFLGSLREGKGSQSSSSELLQTIRQFMTHVKMFLEHSTELDQTIEPFIEDEEEKEHLLEVAMHKSVLKPLRRSILACLREFHTADGSLQQLRHNAQLVRETGPQSLGLRASVKDTAPIEKIRQKFLLMQKTYSPIKKVNFLLQACKLIYEKLEGAAGEACGADEFLPTLSYIIAECDLPELSLEVEYMMELLDQSELMGEGGYYLTSLYASTVELQSFHVDRVVIGISNEIRHSLKQWHKRRRTYDPMPSVNDFQNFIRVAYRDPNNGCTAKTLVVRPTETAEGLCRLCAEKFKVQDSAAHGLFLVVNDSWQLLAGDALPQHIKSELKGQDDSSGYYHFVYRPVDQERPAPPRGNRRLLRDNAIDLGGDLAAEEPDRA
ncbi:ras and Rab interactor 2 [Scyliorhinus canicula]|uniref:ras and Rab interactor 2 n=1 Tax=Scyliorhinus canicula TaxID=7830 RepID=UPI0018F7AC16|nr:ras and Rab interactor 2 [Scyliorhinus canicula]